MSGAARFQIHNESLFENPAVSNRRAKNAEASEFLKNHNKLVYLKGKSACNQNHLLQCLHCQTRHYWFLPSAPMYLLFSSLFTLCACFVQIGVTRSPCLASRFEHLTGRKPLSPLPNPKWNQQHSVGKKQSNTDCCEAGKPNYCKNCRCTKLLFVDNFAKIIMNLY